MELTRSEIKTLMSILDEMDTTMGGLNRSERTIFNKLIKAFHGEDKAFELIAIHKKRVQ